MNTHLRKKKGRDKKQQKTYVENQRKIIDVLCKAYAGQGLNGQGVRQKYLKEKTGIKSPRILRKHLKALEKRSLVSKNKAFWSLTPNRKIVKAWEDMINGLTLKFARVGIDSEEFFSQVAFVFVPKVMDESIIYNANFIELNTWQVFLDFLDLYTKGENAKKLEDLLVRLKQFVKTTSENK